MLGTKNYHTIIPKDYDIFAGLDVDKRSMDITLSDHHQIMKSIHMPNKGDNLLNYVRKHLPNKKVAFVYEAGPTGYGLYDQIITAGYPCLVVAPSMVPTAPGSRVKTNRLDSKKLSVSLRGGALSSIQVPSGVYRDFRHLTQLRDTFIRDVVGFKCRIKALLLFEGIPFPKAPPGSQWSLRVISELTHLMCRPAVRFKLDGLLNSLAFVQQQVLKTTKEIRRFCEDDPEISRCLRFMMSIPGIGWIVASHFLARIGDWRRIRNGRQLASFLGVVPCEDSTGDQTNRGSITRTGDGRVRNKLVQAAWTAIRKDPELAEFYSHIYKGHPKNEAARKAIMAVANKLCKRIACVLRQQRPYVVRQPRTGSVSSKKEETAALQGTTRRFAELGRRNPAHQVRS